MKHRGFTLVELLLALLIISVLAAMLFPVFARARESAHKTECLSNVAQLATALEMYATDWQGALPPKDDDWSPIEPYTKNLDVLHCPMDPKPVSSKGGRESQRSESERPDDRIQVLYSSYVYRAGLSNDGLATEVVAFDRGVWHLGGRNVAFLDAHAKWFAAPAFWQSATPRLLALDPAYAGLNEEQQKAARNGQPIPGGRPWE